MAKIVAGQLATMVLMMIVGVILKKKNYMTEANAHGLSVVLTKVGVPCNMIILLQREYSYEVFHGFLLAAAATFLMCSLGALLFFVIGKFILHMDFPQLGLFSGGGVYSNVIFMGQPLIMAMYGAEGLIYCVSVMFTSNIFLFTVCSVLFSYKCGTTKSPARLLREAFLNLICICAIIGIFLFVNSISLPQPVADMLQYASDANICLSMIYIGSLLASAEVKKVLRDKTVYLFSFLTLIVIPVFTKLVVGNFMSGMALSVVVVLMGTPAAAALPSFANAYGNDNQRASEYVFVSTILSVLTLPLVAQFLCVAA